ncbi:hypothetical protein [Nocardiopsis lucentensis]|uniref:hypothetical protein n=1 Tax=Nocardiopsis lucentensis TaxID=53441 RepID=UPI00034D5FFD|nr:hypothetical protein [Nocardiopsis lucentensis]
MSPRRRGEPGIPADVKLMRELAVRAMRHGVEIDVTTNADRRRAVLAHLDLAERLCEEPLGFERPDQWTGFIPPAMWNQQPNTSPRRKALVEIYDEALARGRASAREEAA